MCERANVAPQRPWQEAQTVSASSLPTLFVLSVPASSSPPRLPDAKVPQLEDSVAGAEDVAGLDVSVDDALHEVCAG